MQPEVLIAVASAAVSRTSCTAATRADVDVIAKADPAGNIRLVWMQRKLIDLIDFLDPDAVRLATPHRARVPLPAAVG